MRKKILCNRLLGTLFLIFSYNNDLFSSSNLLTVNPNITQNLPVLPPLSNATFQWSPWYPQGSDGQGTITFTLSKNVNATISSTLTFTIAGATVTGAYGGQNNPPFSFSGSATGAVTLKAGYASTLVTGTTYSTILSLSKLQKDVGISNLSLKAQSPSTKGSAKVTFTVKGAPLAQSNLKVYVGGISYPISTTFATMETITTQENSPLFLQTPIFDGYSSSCNPQFIEYNPSSPNDTINVVITYTPINRKLAGSNGTLPKWSDHIACGNFWYPGSGSSSTASSLISTGVYDFMMVYTDLGAPIIPPSGDQNWVNNNQYIFQNQIRNLIDLCVSITAAQNGRTCIPVATLYTANLSGGDVQGCLETMGVYGADPTYLMQNLAATASLAYTLENNIGNQTCYTSSQLPITGVIVLNPDYLSYQYQNQGALGDADPALNAYKYNINYVLGFLLKYLETPSQKKASFQKSWNTNLMLQGTALSIQIQTMLLVPTNYTGRYTDTIAYLSQTLSEAWTAYQDKYPNPPLGAPLPSWAPSFQDNYNGYIQAVNYIITRYGPKVLFGWDCGVYFKDIGKNWIYYQNPSQLQSETEKALAFYSKLPLVNVNNPRTSSNFLVFDLASYAPLNSLSNVNQGWLLNGPAFNHWFNFIGKMTTYFGVPAMLWQMSGDPMPTKASTPQWKWGSYYGSLPNFIFGNTYTTQPSDLNPTNPLTLPDGLGDIEIGNLYTPYHPSTTIIEYLSDNGSGGLFDWTTNHLDVLFNAGVFAIQFGGATNLMAGISTQSPAPNNGWLLKSIKNYEAAKNPYPFLISPSHSQLQHETTSTKRS
ncbi:MAG TPA: hypothetical protein VGJ00_09745 [Rhabdochlamydiaceae bacterium]|jgi:hypothetical protein